MADRISTDVENSTATTSQDNELLNPLRDQEPSIEPHMTRSQAWNLYTSHFLSTWNMRMYEFAAIIFTQAAYPDTLVAASIRGMVRTLAAMCFSSMVGGWVDRSPSRLRTLVSTIVINRLSVMAACVLWFFIVENRGTRSPGILSVFQKDFTVGSESKHLMFAVILCFGILETLSAAGNTLSMERDWIVAAASTTGTEYDLTQLNAVMRRIDLICKLVAPVFISIVVSGTNIRIAVLVVGFGSTCSFGVEWYCAQRVWKSNPRLQALKESVPEAGTSPPSPQIFGHIPVFMRQCSKDFRYYFSSVVWIPSLALALLHLSALAYSATLVTFLLNVGISLNMITIARALGSVVEISSTVVTPIGVNYLSKAKNHGIFPRDDTDEARVALLEVPTVERGNEIGIFRLGLWGISWQLINLLPVLVSLYSLTPTTTIPSSIISVSASINILHTLPLFFFLSTSRLGLWIYDLTTQQLTQTMTLPARRSSFAGVENSFVNLFELLQNVIAIILHKPEQFRWIAVISWCCVAVSTVMYAGWVWRKRGHLIHWDSILRSCECVKITLSQN